MFSTFLHTYIRRRGANTRGTNANKRKTRAGGVGTDERGGSGDAVGGSGEGGRCPTGHRLRRRSGEAVGLRCDGGCGHPLRRGVSWWCCDRGECDYDSRKACYDRGQAAARGRGVSEGGDARGGGAGSVGTGGGSVGDDGGGDDGLSGEVRGERRRRERRRSRRWRRRR